MPPARQTGRKKGSQSAPSRWERSPRIRGCASSSRAILDPREVVVLTRDRVQEALDDAVERGRMTRDDATALVAAPVRRAAAADRRPDRASSRRLVPRHADAASCREVDRARRATGIGSNVPDLRLRRPDRGAGQRAPRRPLRARAAQGARLRAAQREPQVRAADDRAQARLSATPAILERVATPAHLHAPAPRATSSS